MLHNPLPSPSDEGATALQLARFALNEQEDSLNLI